jgi:Spy/CpxP family protein refolding chaperone
LSSVDTHQLIFLKENIMKAYRTEFTGSLLAIALLSLLAYASAANADDGRGDGYGDRSGMGRGLMIPARMLDRLDLDDTQRQTVDNIFEAAKPEFDALRERRQANRTLLADLDPADASYAIDLEAAAAENGQLAKDATLLFSRVRNEVNAVLSDDQRAKLKERMDRRKDRRGSRNHGQRQTES